MMSSESTPGHWDSTPKLLKTNWCPLAPGTPPSVTQWSRDPKKKSLMSCPKSYRRTSEKKKVWSVNAQWFFSAKKSLCKCLWNRFSSYWKRCPAFSFKLLLKLFWFLEVWFIYLFILAIWKSLGRYARFHTGQCVLAKRKNKPLRFISFHQAWIASLLQYSDA